MQPCNRHGQTPRQRAWVLGYIGVMFEVLVFVYENYWRGDACPEPQQLGRKLSSAGFEPDEIQQALAWLDGLNFATHGTPLGTEPGDFPAADIILKDSLLPGFK